MHANNDIVFTFPEILCEALYLSVDPYMRPYSENWNLGNDIIFIHAILILGNIIISLIHFIFATNLGCTMVGGQVAKYNGLFCQLI